MSTTDVNSGSASLVMKTLQEAVMIGTHQANPAMLLLEVAFRLNGSIDRIGVTLHGGPSASREGDVLATGILITSAIRQGADLHELVKGLALMRDCPPMGPTNHASIKKVGSVWQFISEWAYLRFKNTPQCRRCKESVVTYRDDNNRYICPRCNFAQMTE